MVTFWQHDPVSLCFVCLSFNSSWYVFKGAAFLLTGKCLLSLLLIRVSSVCGNKWLPQRPTPRSLILSRVVLFEPVFEDSPMIKSSLLKGVGVHQAAPEFVIWASRVLAPGSRCCLICCLFSAWSSTVSFCSNESKWRPLSGPLQPSLAGFGLVLIYHLPFQPFSLVICS